MTVLDARPQKPHTLDRALASLEWNLLESSRPSLTAGETADHPRGSAGFSYVVGGRASIRVGRSDWTEVRAGDLVFFSREHRRRVRADADASMVDVAVAPSVAGRAALDALPDSLVVHRFATHEPHMVALINDMTCTWAPRSVAREGDAVICSRIVTMIASVAVRLWSELGCAPAEWLGSVDDAQIGRTLDGIHADLGRDWTVHDLSRLAMMSRSAFAARFRDVLGQSPLGYVTAARMDAAKGLLARNELAITEIAHRLGYQSDAGFSRAFRRHVGVLPTLWRAEQHTPESA